MSLRIDRPTFLALTFGMAGATAACNTGSGSAVSANVVDIPRQPPQPPATAPRATTTAKLDERPTPEHHDEPEEDAELTSPDDEDDQRCGWVDASSVTRPPGACNDNAGVAPSCSALPVCAGGAAFAKVECEMYRRTYKPKVAQRAIECLNKLRAKTLCDDACSVYRCADRALKSSCPDASVENACKQIVGSCRTASVLECRQYLAGLNAAGRARMISCMTTSCAAGLYSCAEGL